jgi:hypothetical protein
MQTPGALHAVAVYVVVELMLPLQVAITEVPQGEPVHDQLVGWPPPVQLTASAMAVPFATGPAGAPEIVQPVGATGAVDHVTTKFGLFGPGPLILEPVTV